MEQKKEIENQRIIKSNQFLMVDYELLKINKILHNGKEYKFTDSLKNLYSYLKNWTEAFPSHNKVADVFGITREAVKERISKLIQMGLISRQKRTGISNYYIVNSITTDQTTDRSYSENKGTRYEIEKRNDLQYKKSIEGNGELLHLTPERVWKEKDNNISKTERKPKDTAKYEEAKEKILKSMYSGSGKSIDQINNILHLKLDEDLLYYLSLDYEVLNFLEDANELPF